MAASFNNWISKPDETNGPLMSAATWSLVGISAGFLALRLWIRQSERKLWLDDGLLGFSWVSDKGSKPYSRILIASRRCWLFRSH
jgi:hypothetical protein